MRRISIVGSGVVGSAVGKVFAEKGNDVIFYDVSYDPLVRLANEGYKTTEELTYALDNSVISFVAVPTPTVDNSFDYSYLDAVSKDISTVLAEKKTPHIVVFKSTMPPCTLAKRIYPTLNQICPKFYENHALAFNPEFLTEKHPVEDFRNPYRIVIGIVENDHTKHAKQVLTGIYAPFKRPIFFVEPEEAELIKYWSNAELSSKISFNNEMALIASRLGINSSLVSLIVHLDERLGSYGSTAGEPYGGKCLPKDLNAFITHCREKGVEAPLLEAVRNVNREVGGE